MTEDQYNHAKLLLRNIDHLEDLFTGLAIDKLKKGAKTYKIEIYIRTGNDTRQSINMLKSYEPDRVNALQSQVYIELVKIIGDALAECRKDFDAL